MEDVTLSEGRYIRLPLRLLWGMLALAAGVVWSYTDLRGQVEDTKKATAQTSVMVIEDHRAIVEMHDSVTKLGDFADESRRLYNRYFRDYSDPEYKQGTTRENRR